MTSHAGLSMISNTPRGRESETSLRLSRGMSCRFCSIWGGAPSCTIPDPTGPTTQSLLTDCIRSPDTASVRLKMVYASSRDALRRALVGIAAEIQATDITEVAHEIGEQILKPHTRTRLTSCFAFLVSTSLGTRQPWRIDFLIIEHPPNCQYVLRCRADFISINSSSSGTSIIFSWRCHTLSQSPHRELSAEPSPTHDIRTLAPTNDTSQQELSYIKSLARRRRPSQELKRGAECRRRGVLQSQTVPIICTVLQTWFGKKVISVPALV